MIISKSQVDYSVPFDNFGTTFISKNVHDAILEAVTQSLSKARFTLRLANNGVLTNNQVFRYDAIMANTPVVVPMPCKLREVCMSCDSETQDWKLEFYRVRAGVETLLFTWEEYNKKIAYVTNRSDAFLAGDEIKIYFRDVGENPNDPILVLFFEVNA